MSYLDVPRLHFSGLFFTGPNTINNYIHSYDPTVQLTNPQGQYLTNKPHQAPAGWNPLGVAQWWLEECTVLSAVGSNGSPVVSPDTVIGAALQSPSPTTPMSDGTGGFYDLAKMVDLDTHQQGRSAVYGLRIACILPNGAGFQGLMTIPELRQMGARISGATSSWGAVGTWMGTLLNVVWSGDISSSQFLMSLKSASPQALNVKLTVDLHQNNPQNVFTTSDQFCYGRVLGSIGPAASTELPQVVPGRCLQATASSSLFAAIKTDSTPLGARDRVTAKTIAIGAARNEAKAAFGATATAPEPWNPAYAIIRQVGTQTLLSIDIGGCGLLNASPPSPSAPTTSDGTFENPSCVVGVFNVSTGTFTAFVNGTLNLVPQYQPLTSTAKNTTLVKNSCVFSFAITAADGTSYQNNPLAIQVDGTTVAQEYSSGLWIDTAVSSERLQCGMGNTTQTQIMVEKFGNPVSGPTGITSSIQLFDGQTSTDISVAIGNADATGRATVTTKVNVNQLQLPPHSR